MSQEHVARRSWQHKNVRVIDCAKCGYVHQDPLPTPEQVDAYYTEDEFYRTHSAPDWFTKTQKEYEAGLWDSAHGWQTSLLRYHEGGLNLLPKLYDLGCGQGDFMHFYHLRGGEVWGTEPSESARKVHLLPERVTDRMENLRLPGHPRDSVRMSLVLEHVLDPVFEVVKAKEFLLGPRGKFMITVPNEFNPLQNLVAKRVGPWFIQEPHLNYFTRATAKALLEAAGLKVTYATANFPMELFYLLGFKYIGNDTLGRRLHMWRLQFETRLGAGAWSLYHMLYNTLGWGRDATLVAKLWKTAVLED